MDPGKFIVLEGINGCGKGTQLPFLIDAIFGEDKKNTIFATREPNQFDENGHKARGMLLGDGDPYSNQLEAVGYFAMNRKTHNKLFLPLLEQGVTIVSDRYWHSNFAFQHAQGVPYDMIAQANSGSRVPDLTLLFDIPIEAAFERLRVRDGLNRRKFDTNQDFLNSVRENYLELPKILPDLIGDGSIVVLDGCGTVEEVRSRVVNGYQSLLNL
jgi:dTMP kinase